MKDNNIPYYLITYKQFCQLNQIMETLRAGFAGVRRDTKKEDKTLIRLCKVLDINADKLLEFLEEFPEYCERYEKEYFRGNENDLDDYL